MVTRVGMWYVSAHPQDENEMHDQPWPIQYSFVKFLASCNGNKFNITCVV